MNPTIRSIADLTPCGGDVWEVNRVNVPQPHRGYGHGSELLKRLTADADAEGATLVLNIYASGALDHQALVEWYRRNGFTLTSRPSQEDPWMMRRLPQGGISCPRR